MDLDDVRLGGTYSDSATGFTGKATAKTSHLYSKNGEVRLEAVDVMARPLELWVRSERLAKALPIRGRDISETKG